MILGQNPHYVGNVSTQEEKDALIAKYGNQALRPAVKMSKSLGNVVNPDDVVKAYGADTMRLYIMFIGDFEKVATWSDDAVKGCKRFLDRVWNLAEMATADKTVSEKNEPIIHKTIKKVTDDIDTLKMNTAIAALMTMVNEFYANGLTRGDFEKLLLMLSPFAPHMVEELWSSSAAPLSTARWPCRCPGRSTTRARPSPPTPRWRCRSTASSRAPSPWRWTASRMPSSRPPVRSRKSPRRSTGCRSSRSFSSRISSST